MNTVEIHSVEPLRDGLIVKRDEQQHKTAGGIVLPGQAQEAPQWGVVVKAGRGKYDSQGQLLAMSVKKGDRVLFGQYAGSKFKCGSEEYLFLKEEDVMAMIAH